MIVDAKETMSVPINVKPNKEPFDNIYPVA